MGIIAGDRIVSVNDTAIAGVKMAREELGMKPLRTQGLENDFWIILDYGHIVVHVFLTQYREFYRLEDLWADAPKKVYKERKRPAAKDAKAED